MAFSNGPKIITDGLVFCMDAGNTQCFISGESTCTDLVKDLTGTLSGTVYSSDGNGSFSFDGSNDIINLGNQSIGGTTALSVLAWVYLDDTSNTTIIGKYASNNWNIGIYSGLWFGIKTSGWGGITGDNPPTNEWAHVAGTWDGSTQKVYINGVENQSGSKTGTITYGSQDVIIGNLEGATGFYYDGKIGPILVYDKALTATEITQNYNTQKSRFGK